MVATMNKSAIRNNLLNEGGFSAMPGPKKTQTRQQQPPPPHPANNYPQQRNHYPPQQQQQNMKRPPQNYQNNQFPVQGQGSYGMPPSQRRQQRPPNNNGFINHPLQQMNLYDQQQGPVPPQPQQQNGYPGQQVHHPQQQQQRPLPQQGNVFDNNRSQQASPPRLQQQRQNGYPPNQQQNGLLPNQQQNGYPNAYSPPNNQQQNYYNTNQPPAEYPPTRKQAQVTNNQYSNTPYLDQPRPSHVQAIQSSPFDQTPISNHPLPANPERPFPASPSNSEQYQYSSPSQWASDNFKNSTSSNSSSQMQNSQHTTDTRPTRVSSSDSKNAASETQRINYLEEKILLLEKVLASQDLIGKGESSTSADSSNTSSISGPPSDFTITASGNHSHGAPPLPPPPSDAQKHVMSPLASTFMASSANVVDEIKRASKSSLVPTPDPSLDDYTDDGFDDGLPPPSYDELEQSGSLTYTRSIYRTGVEKAGLSSDYFNPKGGHGDGTSSASNPGQKDVSPTRKLNRRLPPPSLAVLAEQDSSYEPNSPLIPPPERLESRKGSSNSSGGSSLYTDSIPNPLPKSSETITSVTNPYLQDSSSTLTISQQLQQQQQRTELVELQEQRQQLLQQQQQQRAQSYESHENIDPLHSSPSFKSPSKAEHHSLKNNHHTKPKKLPPGPLKSTHSYNILSNNVIEPVLPSKSEEPLEVAISRFKDTREAALKDYKKFTPEIQFNWAVVLLESMSRSELISKMDISGKVRRKQVPYKLLSEQRKTFLRTAVKVLQNLVSLAPGKTRARVYLGDIYAGGIHPGLITQDEGKGYRLFYESALKDNDALACYRVACCLESGFGCEKNLEQSNMFLERGAELGDPSAMCQLGMSYFTGVNGIKLDMGKSIEWNNKAVACLKDFNVMGSDPMLSARSFSDSRRALYILAKMYQTDLGLLCLTENSSRNKFRIDQLRKLGVFRNFKQSLYYYIEAAKVGHIESQAALGFLYSRGCFPTDNFKPDKESTSGATKNQVDGRKSIYWYSKAAQADHVYAALGLAKWYGSGAEGILEKSQQQAFLWGRKAADEGQLPEAEFMIGICFEQGFGIEMNKQMAINYFKRSASKRYKKAVSKLNSMGVTI